MNQAEKSVDVGVIMGSKSDLERMSGAWEALDEFGVGYEVRILSAHRSPEATAHYASEAEGRGIQILIAGAGAAAHLAGALAAQTCLPILAVPLATSCLNGLDALLASVQMPRGVPVGVVAIDNSYNAGLLAVQILALQNQNLRQRLKEHKKGLADKIEAANRDIRTGSD